MTFKERNEQIDDLYKRYKAVHDLYTSSTKQLTDEEWEKYIDTMEAITAKYNGTNLQDFAGELHMSFLNDTEEIQKRLRKYEMHI